MKGVFFSITKYDLMILKCNCLMIQGWVDCHDQMKQMEKKQILKFIRGKHLIED